MDLAFGDPALEADTSHVLRQLTQLRTLECMEYPGITLSSFEQLTALHGLTYFTGWVRFTPPGEAPAGEDEVCSHSVSLYGSGTKVKVFLGVWLHQAFGLLACFMRQLATHESHA